MTALIDKSVLRSDTRDWHTSQTSKPTYIYVRAVPLTSSVLPYLWGRNLNNATVTLTIMNATTQDSDAILLEKFKDLGDELSDVILFVLMDSNLS